MRGVQGWSGMAAGLTYASGLLDGGCVLVRDAGCAQNANAHSFFLPHDLKFCRKGRQTWTFIPLP